MSTENPLKKKSVRRKKEAPVQAKEAQPREEEPDQFVTTTEDVVDIMEGNRVVILFDYPLDDEDEDFRWYMAQPKDWVYDMAQAVRDAAISEVMSLEEMDTVKNLPPTGAFVRRQENAKREAQERIDEITEKKDKQELTTEEELELENLREHLTRIIDPKDTRSRADEIAAETGTRAFERYLMPRLVEDFDGNRICDPNTKAGKERWGNLGMNMRQLLRAPFYEALILVNKAKNSNPGQNSK